MEEGASFCKPTSIAHAKLLLVEGRDEFNFFSSLLEHIGVDDIEIREVGGKDKFPSELPAVLKDPGFGLVRIYGIIRDADTSADNTFRSVQGLLRKHREPVPGKVNDFASHPGQSRKVGVFILPGNSATGMLEELCLNTVEDHPIMPCVEGFIQCIESKARDASLEPNRYKLPKCMPKAKARAFLAGMCEDVPSVGIGAQKKCWNLDHPRLDLLRGFLEHFRG